MTGTVKTKTDKGFGFISRDGESKDLFFHSSDLVGISFQDLQAILLLFPELLSIPISIVATS